MRTTRTCQLGCARATTTTEHTPEIFQSCHRVAGIPHTQARMRHPPTAGVHVDADCAEEEFSVIKGRSKSHILFDDFINYSVARGLALDDFRSANQAMRQLRCELQELTI